MLDFTFFLYILIQNWQKSNNIFITYRSIVIYLIGVMKFSKKFTWRSCFFLGAKNRREQFGGFVRRYTLAGTKFPAFKQGTQQRKTTGRVVWICSNRKTGSWFITTHKFSHHGSQKTTVYRKSITSALRFLEEQNIHQKYVSKRKKIALNWSSRVSD